MKKALITLAVLAAAGFAGGLLATAPSGLPLNVLEAMPAGDAARGETVFWASGCASCHAAPGAKDDAKLVLAGGLELNTDFGVFVAPNISPSAEGIGWWTFANFANAMLKGASPEGTHYYPAFPYSSYRRMTHQDVADLWAYLQTLPRSANEPAGNRLAFPYSVRLAVGGWKLFVMGSDDPVVSVPADDAVLQRGRYLVEGPGHCGECHTPRNALGGLVLDRWLAGGPNPDGEGRIPNITPGSKDMGAWSASDIVAYLETGFTPEFDSVGGSMASVQQNMSKLPKTDLEAIAAYLKAVPAVAD